MFAVVGAGFNSIYLPGCHAGLDILFDVWTTVVDEDEINAGFIVAANAWLPKHDS